MPPSEPHSSHFDAAGQPQMVDVSAKHPSTRIATAVGIVRMQATTGEMIQQGTAKKGDVLAVARIAAIQAAKLTSQLIPLCHAIPIEAVAVTFDWSPTASSGAPDRQGAPDASAIVPRDDSPHAELRCRVTVRTTAKTGVEMEALTAVSVACLTIYDMAKSVDRAMTIGPILLLTKTGGKSGDFHQEQP